MYVKAPIAVWRWPLLGQESHPARKALEFYRKRNLQDSEKSWIELLPELSKNERPEALWYLARSQMEQGKYAEAIKIFKMLEGEGSGRPHGFQAAIQEGILHGHYFRDWKKAERAWKKASDLALDDRETREAACRLATVPFFEKDYSIARKRFARVLRDDPSRVVAEFVKPFLPYLLEETVVIEDCQARKVYEVVNNIIPGRIITPKDHFVYVPGETILLTATPGLVDHPFHFEYLDPNCTKTMPQPDADIKTIIPTWDDGGAGGTFTPLKNGKDSYVVPGATQERK